MFLILFIQKDNLLQIWMLWSDVHYEEEIGRVVPLAFRSNGRLADISKTMN